MYLGAITKAEQLRIRRRRKQGFGEGEGADYKPWLTVRSFGSRGTSHRLVGKHGRQYHLFSDGEYRCALVLEWSDTVLDVRDQYPLHDVEETIRIAHQLGVRHPAPMSRGKMTCPPTMTTDFLVTISGLGGQDSLAAIYVKPSANLEQATEGRRKVQRLLQKAEIERTYWSRRNVPFKVVTERDIPENLWRNLDLILPLRTLDGYAFRTDPDVALDLLHRRIEQAGDAPLRDACSRVDRELGLEAGSGLTLAFHALASKKWIADMTTLIDAGRPLRCARA